MNGRSYPSSFDLSGDFELRTIPLDYPWSSLGQHLARVQPHAVLGFCPPKLQIDPRIYDFVRARGVPYVSIDPRNAPLACEVMQQMSVDFVVATRAEALALEEALKARGRAMPHWHVIMSQHEHSLPLPAGAVADVHEFPGKSYEH